MINATFQDPSVSAQPAAAVRRHRWLWLAAAGGVALIPFVQGLTGARVFYIRDLGMFFWGRYLFLRRAWLSGEWPLWDPFVGGGQAVYSDPLHQMFLPPAIVVRLLGGEVLGFNLWVALPFPLAAIGAFVFFGRRFSAPASALGAMAFALCGPVISGGNFPNMSWSVAAIPWVMWSADLVMSRPAARPLAALAVAVALACLAGEPVTVFTTAALVLAYALTFADAPHGMASTWTRVRPAGFVIAGLVLGGALAAVQMVPMVYAAMTADRSGVILQDLWSLRPTALLETVWLHLFGNYYEVREISELPWMPLMYTDREPFFFSIYFGVPLLALAAFGLAGTAPRRWRLFWLLAGFIALVASFGSYTPIYPILRDYVPPFGSFRFPVKYFVVTALAVAAGAAAGWDTVAGRFAPEGQDTLGARRHTRARLTAFTAALVPGALAATFAAVCLFAADAIRGPLDRIARAFGDRTGDAAEFMIRTVPASAGSVIVPACAAALLFWFAARPWRWAAPARAALFLLIVTDLAVKGIGINPVLDPAHFDEPAWLAHTRTDRDARFYVGAKLGGTILGLDLDAHGGYLDIAGLSPAAWRAAVISQAAFYPSAWHGREMLSYDLPVLWPKPLSDALERFIESPVEARERFLDRTGVRYRILPERRGKGHPRLAAIRHFNGSFLYDWGDVARRAAIVPAVRVVPDVDAQVAALFEDGWDSRQVALVEREPPLSGEGGTPVPPFARFVEDRWNRAVIEAGTGETGGYLLVLDSYSDDWRVTVDGRASAMVRANGLFRVVRLAPGTHRVEFDFRPRPLFWGAGITAIAAAAVLALLVRDRRRTNAAGPATSAAPAGPR